MSKMDRMMNLVLALLGFGSMPGCAAAVPAAPALPPAAAPVYYQAPEKKIICCGWEQAMSAAQLRDKVEELQEYSPCRGVAFRLYGRHPQGYVFSTHFAFSPEPSEGHGVDIIRWEYDWFKEEIAILKSIKFTRLTDNFFWTNSRDGNVDWFNDKNWDDVCHNFGILSRIAKETGMKGLMFDAEWYSNSQAVFSRIAPGKSYEEMAAKARERGRQWGRAIFAEYPDITLFCPFIFSWKESMRGAPECCNWTVAFFNGVYDVLPPQAKMVEGHEYHGYACANGADYAALRWDMTQILPQLVAKENVDKFRRQTRLSCALYVDPYVFKQDPNTFTRRIYPEIERSNRLTVLRRNLFHALNTSDEYVWLWGEGARWYYSRPAHPGAKGIWQQEAPGIRGCFDSVVEPLKYARRLVAKKQAKLVSVNSDLTGDFVKVNRPRGYDFWLPGKNPSGTCTPTPGAGIGGRSAVSVTGCSSGFVFTQEFDVTGDRMYYAKVKIRRDKIISGKYALGIRYRDAAGRYSWYRDCVSCRFGEPDADGWCTAELTALVPAGMTRMYVYLNGSWLQPEDKVTIGLFEVWHLQEKFLPASVSGQTK